MKIYREITLLDPKDVFVIFNYPNAHFDYPLHNHPEYEINLIMNASGNRIVGDKVEKYEDLDFVLLGPHLSHNWDGVDTDKKKHPTTHTIVLQFDENLFTTGLLSKTTFLPIQKMLNYSVRGIEFRGKTREMAIKKMFQLVDLDGFKAAIVFLELLELLAYSNENHLIASAGYTSTVFSPEKKRMDKIYDFIMNNYQTKITVKQLASMVNMSESAFSHFFKKSTNRSFSQFLTDTRLTQACKLLLETQNSVREICYQCGYTNLSNFNRLFKKYKGMAPVAYRSQLSYEYPVVDNRRFQLK